MSEQDTLGRIDAPMNPEVTISLAENAEGWWIKFGFDDGAELWSAESYPSRRDAEIAVTDWCAANGATAITAQ